MSYAGTFGLPPFIGNNANPNSATAVGGGANRGQFQAVYVPQTVVMTGIRYVCTVSSGNIDVGVYDSSGNRLASSGSTASPGTDRQTINFSSSVALAPGTYWLALSADNTTATFARSAGVTADGVVGYCVVTSAFPLPSSVTLNTGSGNGIALAGIITGGVTI